MPGTKRAQAVPTVQLDDGVVRVTRWDFAAQAETGHHRHEFDYVVVPVTTGRLRIETQTGDDATPDISFAELTIGQSYARKCGVEHNVINDNDFALAFVEIEQL